MINVVVVQHAEKAAGGSDPGLSELGVLQARRTADLLLTEGVGSTIYASPLRRARETAAVIVSASGAAVVIDDRLRERVNWDGG